MRQTNTNLPPHVSYAYFSVPAYVLCVYQTTRVTFSALTMPSASALGGMAYLKFANGLHLLVNVLIEQLHSLLQAQVPALGVQDIHFQPGQLILKLNHQHLLIVHCNQSESE